MADRGKFTSKDFTQPKFILGEVESQFGTISYINTELFKVSRPTLVDYIWIGEESYTVNGWPLPAGVAVQTHTSFLTNLRVNWWVSDRGRTDLRLRIPTIYDNYVDAERFVCTLPAAPGNAQVFGTLLYRFRQPWRYLPGSSFTVDFAYVTGDAVNNAGDTSITDVVFYGVGVRTRHRRIFEMQMPVVTMVGMPATTNVVTGSFTQPEFVSNVADEPYDLTEMQIRIFGAWHDLRQLNMLRYRIVPGQGEPFSDDPIPILAYGVDQTPANRAVLYEPTGGPLLLEEGTSIGWEVQNIHWGLDTRFQAVLVGRVAPNR